MGSSTSERTSWRAISAAAGVVPEDVVAICMDRSVDMVVSVLGVVKAGAAYLPLDPAYPKDRLEFMLKDAQVPVLLSDSKQLPRLPAFESVVCLDRDWAEISDGTAADFPVRIQFTKPCLRDLYVRFDGQAQRRGD